jgi:hypothetical protein
VAVSDNHHTTVCRAGHHALHGNLDSSARQIPVAMAEGHLWLHTAGAVLARLALAQCGLGEVLQRRIEVATPLTSLLRIRCPRSLAPCDHATHYRMLVFASLTTCPWRIRCWHALHPTLVSIFWRGRQNMPRLVCLSTRLVALEWEAKWLTVVFSAHDNPSSQHCSRARSCGSHYWDEDPMRSCQIGLTVSYCSAGRRCG